MRNVDEKELKRARRKVKHLRHFYRHLATYGVIILFLHILNWMTSSYYWAMWPMLGWGIAVALHATQVMDFLPMFDEDWEEKKVQELLAKRAERAQNTPD